MGQLRDVIRRIFEQNASGKPFLALWKWAREPAKEVDRHDRWQALAEWASDERVKSRGGSPERKKWAERQGVYEGKARATHPNGGPDVPDVVHGGWHPQAQRSQCPSTGPMSKSMPAKLCWHTTEGLSMPVYSGTNPHFTIEPKTGGLVQHIPIGNYALALENHEGGGETNRWNCIQVEIRELAGRSGDWPLSYYDNLAELARWIELHAGVKRACSVAYENMWHGMSVDAFYHYGGHLGHQHVPEQWDRHYDPGGGFRQGAIL